MLVRTGLRKVMRRGVTGEQAPRIAAPFSRVRRVFLARKVVLVGFIILIIVVLAAVFAPLIAPYDPYLPDFSNLSASPSSAHLLGTDSLGRDVLSRVIYGSQTSLLVGLIAIGIATVIGTALGLIAGFFGGLTYAIIMRLVDTLMSLPIVLIAIAVAAALGGGLQNIMIAVGVAMIPQYARLMCGQVMVIRESDYIVAGRVIGAGNIRTMWWHLMPNAFPPMIILMTTMLGMAILAEAGISFLGMGINPPGAAWGAMVAEGYRFLLSNPVLSLAPGLAIMVTVFAFNMVGDGLRDALDPRLRGTL